MIVFAAGGSLEAAFLPQRLLFFRADYGVSVAAAVSPGALEFVTRTALVGVTGKFVYDPETRFEPSTARPAHIALADAQLLVVYPATARILAQCAIGEITCPVTRLFAFVPKERIVVAPALHPRMDRRIYEGHAQRLRELGCTVLGGAELGASWAEVEAHVVARLSLVKERAGDFLDLDALLQAEQRRELAARAERP